MITFQWIPVENNLADLISKTTLTGDFRYNFVQEIFYKFGENVENWDL